MPFFLYVLWSKEIPFLIYRCRSNVTNGFSQLGTLYNGKNLVLTLKISKFCHSMCNCELFVCGTEANCHTRNIGLRVFFLRDLSSYLCKFLIKPRKTPNSCVDQRDRGFNPAPLVCQFWKQNLSVGFINSVVLQHIFECILRNIYASSLIRTLSIGKKINKMFAIASLENYRRFMP